MNGPPNGRLRVELSIEVDDELVEADRERYLEEDPDLTNFYGRPAEWGPETSILDVFDAHAAGALLRSEVVSVRKAPAPYGEAKPSLMARLFAKLGIGATS